jgi:hypothetical protein
MMGTQFKDGMKILNVLLILTALLIAGCNPKVADPGAVTGATSTPVNAFALSVTNKYYLEGEALELA